MSKVSVIIPFFQHRQGILRRALLSVLGQKLPLETTVDVIIVDDGSPAPVASEIDSVSVRSPFHLNIISQSNAGVGAARNAGLKGVDPSTTYVAFLDSDDIWQEGHLQRGLQALNEGHDFYFCDNRRAGMHDSYFAAHCPKLLNRSGRPSLKNGCVELAKEDAIGFILRCCPTQASTVIFRRDVCSSLLFEESVKASGEDLIFFSQLAARASRICYSPTVMVECADGINMFFGHYFDWDSPNRLLIAYDQVVCHSLIRDRLPLSRANRIWLDKLIASRRRDFVFFSLRYIVKFRKWPPELYRFAKITRWFPIWYAYTVAWIIISRPLGLYRPF